MAYFKLKMSDKMVYKFLKYMLDGGTDELCLGDYTTKLKDGRFSVWKSKENIINSDDIYIIADRLITLLRSNNG